MKKLLLLSLFGLFSASAFGLDAPLSDISIIITESDKAVSSTQTDQDKSLRVVSLNYVGDLVSYKRTGAIAGGAIELARLSGACRAKAELRPTIREHEPDRVYPKTSITMSILDTSGIVIEDLNLVSVCLNYNSAGLEKSASKMLCRPQFKKNQGLVHYSLDLEKTAYFDSFPLAHEQKVEIRDLTSSSIRSIKFATEVFRTGVWNTRMMAVANTYAQCENFKVE